MKTQLQTDYSGFDLAQYLGINSIVWVIGYSSMSKLEVRHGPPQLCGNPYLIWWGMYCVPCRAKRVGTPLEEGKEMTEL